MLLSFNDPPSFESEHERMLIAIYCSEQKFAHTEVSKQVEDDPKQTEHKMVFSYFFWKKVGFSNTINMIFFKFLIAAQESD